MKAWRLLVTFFIVIICVGCTAYKVNPPIGREGSKGAIEVASFEINNRSPWERSVFVRDAYEVTGEMLLGAAEEKKRDKHLVVNIDQRFGGGACTQEYFTGLSLGLIPSWCTRPEMYRFEFVLIAGGEECRRENYSIDIFSFAHIFLLPFAFVEGKPNPLDIYQASLRDFIKEQSCEAS